MTSASPARRRTTAVAALAGLVILLSLVQQATPDDGTALASRRHGAPAPRGDARSDDAAIAVPTAAAATAPTAMARAATPIRGVAPSAVPRLLANRASHSRLNDEYCDDGADEPGVLLFTHACPVGDAMVAPGSR